MSAKTTKTSCHRPPSEAIIRIAREHAVFTSGQVAEIIGCAPRTVGKWMEAGEFPNSYRLPLVGQPRARLSNVTEGDRRITRPDLLAFCTKYQIRHALDLLCPAHQLTVVTVGVSAALAGRINLALAGRTNSSVVDCHDLFDLADLLSSSAKPRPDLLVLDLSLGRAAIRKTVARVAAAPPVFGRGPTRVLVVMAEGDEKDADLPVTATQRQEAEVDQEFLTLVLATITQPQETPAKPEDM